MASEREEWIRTTIERWNEGDVEGYLAELGPSFEFTPDPSFPDADTYSGEKWHQWLLDWAKIWGESRLEILGLSEHGSAVVIESRWHLTAKTGAQVPVSDFNIVVWFEDRPEVRPLRGAAFFDRGRALEMARGTG